MDVKNIFIIFIQKYLVMKAYIDLQMTKKFNAIVIEEIKPLKISFVVLDYVEKFNMHICCVMNNYNNVKPINFYSYTNNLVYPYLRNSKQIDRILEKIKLELNKPITEMSFCFIKNELLKELKRNTKIINLENGNTI